MVSIFFSLKILSAFAVQIISINWNLFYLS